MPASVALAELYPFFDGFAGLRIPPAQLHMAAPAPISEAGDVALSLLPAQPRRPGVAGQTSLLNGALLCGRHPPPRFAGGDPQIARQRGWTATATTSEITWHL